uniref:Uncharacterized protein n=1 Tax=Caenorhabditis japonica TaxID=281687 RepID=A0A8R1IA14_CAEJA
MLDWAEASLTEFFSVSMEKIKHGASRVLFSKGEGEGIELIGVCASCERFPLWYYGFVKERLVAASCTPAK